MENVSSPQFLADLARLLQNQPVYDPALRAESAQGDAIVRGRGEQQQGGGSSGGGSSPPGLSQFLGQGGGAGAGGANTAGAAATDSGSWGASPYGFADFSGAGGGLGDGAASGLGGSAGGASGGGASGLGGLASFAPFGYAAAIGVGANTEANHANTPLGDGLLATMGPSAAQMWKDPVGMGLPTLLGAPFLTPFTASKDAKATKPEFSSLFGLGF